MDYLGRNLEGGAPPEDKYDEEWVINILSEQAKLKLIYGKLFANQSNDGKQAAEIKDGTSEKQTEKQGSQSQLNRTIEMKDDVNKLREARNVHPNSLEVARKIEVAHRN